MLGSNNQDQQDFISEINVTPLVDVVLVLLIIFMISAPLLMNHITLQLPKTKKVQKLTQNMTTVTVSLDSNGQIYVDKIPMSLEKLENYFQKKFITKDMPSIFLRADEKTNYKYIAKTLAILKSLNLTQISLVTEIEKK